MKLFAAALNAVNCTVIIIQARIVPGNYTVGITFSMQLPPRLLDHVCVTHGEVWECVYCVTNNPSMGTNPRTVKRKTF